jgi:SH3-like domain-containing protein
MCLIKDQTTKIAKHTKLKTLLSELSALSGKILFLLLFLVSSAHAQESLNNLPLPRWASLASDKVNARVGPGERYPIDWILTHQDMPVEIVQEFENWRQIKLHDGTTGWVHRAMLAGTRYGLIQSPEQLLYRNPSRDSAVHVKLKQNVLIRLEKCQKEWCFGSIRGFEGWLPKASIWGIYKSEVFD